jgi:hypothetical protein
VSSNTKRGLHREYRPQVIEKPHASFIRRHAEIDKAVAGFATAYADQCERDRGVFLKAARAGKIEIFLERD